MPERVIEALNKMGKRNMESNVRSQECRLEFKNCLRERFTWDNGDLEENDPNSVWSSAGLTIAHVNLLANHPGIAFESKAVEDGSVEVLVSRN